MNKKWMINKIDQNFAQFHSRIEVTESQSCRSIINMFLEDVFSKLEDYGFWRIVNISKNELNVTKEYEKSWNDFLSLERGFSNNFIFNFDKFFSPPKPKECLLSIFEKFIIIKHFYENDNKVKEIEVSFERLISEIRKFHKLSIFLIQENEHNFDRIYDDSRQYYIEWAFNDIPKMKNQIEEIKKELSRISKEIIKYKEKDVAKYEEMKNLHHEVLAEMSNFMKELSKQNIKKKLPKKILNFLVKFSSSLIVHVASDQVKGLIDYKSEENINLDNYSNDFLECNYFDE